MEQNFIVCDNLVKIYKLDNLEIIALQGLDLVVKKTEMVGIVGVSGSGKSTLMNILGGLDRPSAGKVWVDGQDMLKLPDRGLNQFRSQKVGFVWQQTSRNLIPYLSAIENVYLPLTISGNLTTENREYCEFLLESMGMADHLTHKPAELSGGQQQRVAIAVSLANRPVLLLADEPTGDLDSRTALEIYDILYQQNQTLGLTTLIVSHDQAIAHHVDRVVAIRDGRLSSETIRQNRATHTRKANADAPEQTEAFEELTVIDSVGRLQIPQEHRQHFEMRGRVRLEIQDDGILIKPAPEVDYAEDAELLTEEFQAKQNPWYQKLGRKTRSLYRRIKNKGFRSIKKDEE